MSQLVNLRKFTLILVLGIFSLGILSCTSSEQPQDQTALDAELDTLDADPTEIADGDEDTDIEDIEDASEDSIEDELGEGDDEGDGGSEFEDEDKELEGEIAEDDEDDEDGDDEDDDFDEEFAEGDDDEDEEDDKKQKPSDEEALAQELGQDGQYPDMGAASAEFPEEIQNQPPADGAMPADATAQNAPPIVSVTQIDNTNEPPAEEQIPQDDLGVPDPIVAKPDDFDSGQNWVPVVKMKTDPFFRNSRLMNAVYVARPGDTLETVSSKVFGSTDKSATLLDDNPYLDRGIDPGDKIYYNSPNNPDQKDNIKVYYEDIGLKSNKYVTKLGDNMRRLGSKLLGFQEGWKEVWAINLNVDSKTELEPGIELRYWTGDEPKIMAKAEIEEQAAEPIVENIPSSSTNAGIEEDMAPEPPALTDTPMPDPAQLPEAPPAQAGADVPVDLPISDPGELPPAPEEDSGSVTASTKDDGGAEAAGTDFLTIGIMGIVMMAVVVLVSIQIKNRRAQTQGPPPSLEFTQV